MATLQREILNLLSTRPGLTDREITNALRSPSDNQQPINQAARLLDGKGLLVRQTRADGLIGNYLCSDPELASVSPSPPPKNHDVDAFSEDEIKEVLVTWLESDGWNTEVAWGRTRGIDIEAVRGPDRWVIEVKGPGSRQPMRVNYFLGILGETLQRMDDGDAKYSISLPDLPQYRGLWERLPQLAKARTQISILFVAKDGTIELLNS